MVNLWPNNAPTLLLADPDAIKVSLLVTPSIRVPDPQSLQEVVLNRPNFPKPTEVYETLSIFGRNIVITEHDEWRKHRKVASPAFSERNNALVFQETTRIVLDLFQMWKEQGNEDMIVIPDMTHVTFELALQVIASAAFGYSIAWKDEGKIPRGHTMVRLPFIGSFGLCSSYASSSISDVQERSQHRLQRPNTEDDLV